MKNMKTGKEYVMRPALRLLLLGVWMWMACLQSFAREIKVVASPGVKADTISMAELKRVFLMQQRTLNDGSSVEPVLQQGGWVHELFVRDYLNRDSEEIRVYYQGLVFTGKSSMPKQLGSDADVVTYIAGANGAIGYVSTAADTPGVKVLSIVPEKSRGKRTLVTRVEPEYPRELQQRGIEGIVRLELTVAPRGSVDSAKVLGGNPILAEAAVRAAKQWIYSPAATTTTIEVSIPFEGRP
jgi:TonB family protein